MLNGVTLGAGILATVAALLGATSALQKGNRTQFNKMLRYRVAAQGLTVIAALGELKTQFLQQYLASFLINPRRAVLQFRWICILSEGEKSYKGS